MSENNWTDSFLDQMRKAGDPLGDETVDALFRNHGIESVNSLWDVLLKNSQIPPEGFPDEIYDYLERSAQFPPWANRRLINQGERFFSDHGIFCLLSLLCASLPECYAIKNGAQVLAKTQRLEDHVYRRLFETAQMVLAVMAPGGLDDKGRGVRAAQKVRLMHAAIRHLILQPPPKIVANVPAKSFAEILRRMEWDREALGHPINQEDMAFTLLTFSYVVLRALRDMGIEVTERDANAYLHCWNVVGHIMGLRRELLAHTFEEAETLFSRIKQRQAGESEEGKALNQALITCTGQIFLRYTKIYVPKFLVRQAPVIIIRQLMSEETVTMLGMKRLMIFEWIALKLLRGLEFVAKRFYDLVARSAGKTFGLMLAQRLTEFPRGWNRELFDMPEALKIKWKIEVTRPQQPTVPPPG